MKSCSQCRMEQRSICAGLRNIGSIVMERSLITQEHGGPRCDTQVHRNVLRSYLSSGNRLISICSGSPRKVVFRRRCFGWDGTKTGCEYARVSGGCPSLVTSLLKRNWYSGGDTPLLQNSAFTDSLNTSENNCYEAGYEENYKPDFLECKAMMADRVMSLLSILP